MAPLLSSGLHCLESAHQLRCLLSKSARFAMVRRLSNGGERGKASACSRLAHRRVHARYATQKRIKSSPNRFDETTPLVTCEAYLDQRCAPRE